MEKPGVYPFGSKTPGVLHVFNNVEFDAESGLMRRRGSNLDASMLNTVFKLHYNFSIGPPHNDLTQIQFLKEFEEICKADYEKIDCLALAFLTHGREGKLWMKDYEVDICDIIQKLKQVKQLRGKPKILILQACRGIQVEQGQNFKKVSIKEESDPDSEWSAPVGEKEEEEEEEECDDTPGDLPLSAEFVFCKATTKGFKSYRHPTEGSRYIRTFCQVLQQYAEGPSSNKLDFLQLLTIISSRVAEMKNNSTKRQMPSFSSTFTKSLYLPRNETQPVSDHKM